MRGGGMMMGFNPYMGGYFMQPMPVRGRGRGFRYVSNRGE